MDLIPPGLFWVKWTLMFDKPELVKVLELSQMTEQDWELLSERCYSAYQWHILLQLRPQFADRCPWEKLNGRDWEHSAAETAAVRRPVSVGKAA